MIPKKLREPILIVGSLLIGIFLSAYLCFWEHYVIERDDMRMMMANPRSSMQYKTNLYNKMNALGTFYFDRWDQKMWEAPECEPDNSELVMDALDAGYGVSIYNWSGDKNCAGPYELKHK